MAKVYGKKEYIGEISKLKDNPKKNKLKVTKDLTLKKGQYLSLESVADQIKDLKEGAEKQRISEDYAAERIAKLEESRDKYGLLFTITYTPVTEG